MPQDAWAAIWKMILEWVEPAGDVPELRWTQTVRPSYSAAEKLPADAEAQAVRRAAAWFTTSRVLRHPDWPQEALDWALTYNTVRDKPGDDWPLGDGSLGMLEGYSSTIRLDGLDLVCERAVALPGPTEERPPRAVESPRVEVHGPGAEHVREGFHALGVHLLDGLEMAQDGLQLGLQGLPLVFRQAQPGEARESLEEFAVDHGLIRTGGSRKC